MPEWITPELCPVWCWPIFASLSRIVIFVRGAVSRRERAVARPTIPAPTIAMSCMTGRIIGATFEEDTHAGEILRRARNRYDVPPPARAHDHRGGQRLLLLPHDESPAAPRRLSRRGERRVQEAAREQHPHAWHRGRSLGR